MILLYDEHCHICAVFAWILCRSTRHKISILPLGSDEAKPFEVLIAESGYQPWKSAWMIDQNSAFSGIYLILQAVKGVVRGMGRGRPCNHRINDLYSEATCTVPLPCRGFRGLIIRVNYFVLSTRKLRVSTIA